MVKHRKRKGNKGGNKGNKVNIPTTPKTAPAPPSKSNTVNRIRHGEIRVRHGALTALSSTMFSAESLSRSSNSIITMELLQAISERIMEEDVPVSMCALGCIGNYVLFQENQAHHGNKVETLLTPIILTRMNKACDGVEKIAKEMTALEQKLQLENAKAPAPAPASGVIESSSTNADVPGKKKKKKQQVKQPISPMQKLTSAMMEQWSIQSLCLHALCGIVEGTATNNESSSILHHQRNEFLSTVMRSFLLASEIIQALSAATTTAGSSSAENGSSDMNGNKMLMIATKENQSNIISDVVTYALRTIHSSCDENVELLTSLLSMKGASGDVFQCIISSISNTSLPALARIHCCAIVILSRKIIASSSSVVKSVEELQQLLVTQVLPLLSQFTLYSTDIASALYARVKETHEKLLQEKTDASMEKEIMHMVDKRKESARLIARRQKVMKKEQKEQKEKEKMEAESAVTDNSMDAEGADAEAQEKAEKEAVAAAAAEEMEDQYDKAINAWKNACLPLKLSVEVIANMCVSGDNDPYSAGGGKGGLDDDMAWDSDEEERHFDEQHQQHQGIEMSKEDEAFFNQVADSGVLDRVLAVFGGILLSLMNSKNDAEVQSIHPLAVEDLVEVVEKCSICLGNAACNLPAWKKNESDVTSIWHDFMQCLKAVKCDPSSNTPNIPFAAIASILSTMGAFLRFRTALVKCVNEQDLNLILSFVTMEITATPKDDNSKMQNADMTAIEDLQKDAIGMLGILCSEPHPDEVNDKICNSFLTTLHRHQSTTTTVMNEILISLMEMYSSDEGDPNNHEQVFKSRDVLGSFQKIIPMFKRKIREGEKMDGISFDDIELWRETAVNAGRFVKYKKGQ